MNCFECRAKQFILSGICLGAEFFHTLENLAQSVSDVLLRGRQRVSRALFDAERLEKGLSRRVIFARRERHVVHQSGRTSIRPHEPRKGG